MQISRSDLYERVWTSPLKKLAAEFGISDVGLAKSCRRHAIPTPPMGHWTSVEHGKGYPRLPLPAAPHGDTVTFSEELSRTLRSAAKVASLPNLAVELKSEASVSAPFAMATTSALRKVKPQAGFHTAKGSGQYNCSVSESCIERAAIILDALERGLPQIGAKVVRGQEHEPAFLDFDGQAVKFALTERYTRSEFIPESQRSSPYPLKQYEYHFTGELKLAIDGYFEGRKTWSDGVRARLEDKLAEMLAGLAGAASALRKHKADLEEQRRHWAEVAKIREQSEEQKRRRVAFRDAFAMEAEGWQRHQSAKAYLAHLQQKLEAGFDLPDLSAQWLAHAQQAIQDLDPTSRRLALLQQGDDPGYYGPFGKKLLD